ncbi:MAG TPA: hypothetical protein VMR62_10770 [Bryobacteraceae bacterium]|jgi:hypothetical protein|nr:hypothetical protein [Bryobacteraceae bacterium]
MWLIDKKDARPVCRQCRKSFPATERQIAEFRRAGTLILCERHREQLRAEATHNADASRMLLAAYWRRFGAV